MKSISLLTIAIVGAVAFASCKKKKEDEPQPQQETQVEGPSKKQQFLSTYASIAHTSFTEAKTAAQVLQTAINSFVGSPDASKLEACKTAYKAARVAYLQCEVFRGPVGNPLDSAGAEGFINSWPLDEGYIDYTFADNGGIVVNTDTVKINGKLQGYVNDRTKTISDVNLLGSNGEGSDANISVGFHAIEFLLWGQDIYVDSPGKRPYTDYVTGTSATAPNADRRGEYLKVCATILVDILDQVAEKWKPDVAGNYRANFLATSRVDASLKSVLSGMIKLTKGEFGGERILPALAEDASQEEEHSCFSDLTKDDFKYDVIGYENILTGVYKQQLTGLTLVNSIGLSKLVEEVASAKASNLAMAIADLKSKTDVVYNATLPYDQIIVKPAGNSDKAAVQSMSDAWVKLSERLNEANTALGYEVVNPDEE